MNPTSRLGNSTRPAPATRSNALPAPRTKPPTKSTRPSARPSTRPAASTSNNGSRRPTIGNRPTRSSTPNATNRRPTRPIASSGADRRPIPKVRSKLIGIKDRPSPQLTRPTKQVRDKLNDRRSKLGLPGPRPASVKDILPRPGPSLGADAKGSSGKGSSDQGSISITSPGKGLSNQIGNTGGRNRSFNTPRIGSVRDFGQRPIDGGDYPPGPLYDNRHYDYDDYDHYNHDYFRHHGYRHHDGYRTHHYEPIYHHGDYFHHGLFGLGIWIGYHGSYFYYYPTYRTHTYVYVSPRYPSHYYYGVGSGQSADDAVAALEAGWMSLEYGNYITARQRFARASRLAPDWGLPRIGYAIASAATGNDRSAEQLMRRAFELDPYAALEMPWSDEIVDVLVRLEQRYTSNALAGYNPRGSWFMAAATRLLLSDPESAADAAFSAEAEGDVSTSLSNLIDVLASAEQGAQG